MNIINIERNGGIYMAKTANLYIRMEPDLKEKAEAILSMLGISSSSAINMFYKQIILQKGLPFEVKIPDTNLIDYSTLSSQELDEEIEKGYNEIKENKVKDMNDVFNDIRNDYKL